MVASNRPLRELGAVAPPRWVLDTAAITGDLRARNCGNDRRGAEDVEPQVSALGYFRMSSVLALSARSPSLESKIFQAARTPPLTP